MKGIISYVMLILLCTSCLNASKEQEKIPHKSTAIAFCWSLGSTLVPCSVLLMSTDVGVFTTAAGILVGPSVGHFYAQQYGRGFSTIGARAILGVVGCGFLAGYAIASALSPLEDMPDDLVAVFGLIGAGIAISAVIDFATLPQSVQKYNESVVKKSSMHFVPRIDLSKKQYGLSLVYNF